MSSSKDIVLKHLHHHCGCGNNPQCKICSGTGFVQKTLKEIKKTIPETISPELVSTYLQYFIKNGYADRELLENKGCTEIYNYWITESGVRWLFRIRNYIIIEETGD